MNALQYQIQTNLQNAIREVHSCVHALARTEITPDEAKAVFKDLGDFRHELANVQTVYYGIAEKLLTPQAIRECDVKQAVTPQDPYPVDRRSGYVPRR